MKKILVIGKRGFLGNNISKYLKQFHKLTHKDMKSFNNYKLKIKNYDYVINTSINKQYINKKYDKKFDNDLRISNFIGKKTIFIFLSTRKVYKSGKNIKETGKLLPLSNYSKNKLITEKKLSRKLNNLVILRISNVIGDKSKIKKIHNTFVDIFFQNIEKGFIIDNKKKYKDFISIYKFCEILNGVINKNLRGIFNVSIGKKIYLNDIVSWLNTFNKKKFIKKNMTIKEDSFFLNNRKIMSKLKIKNSISELKNYCIEISKKKFT